MPFGMGVLVGVVIVEGRGSFGGEFGASYCNQRELCCVVVRDRRTLPKVANSGSRTTERGRCSRCAVPGPNVFPVSITKVRITKICCYEKTSKKNPTRVSPLKPLGALPPDPFVALPNKILFPRPAGAHAAAKGPTLQPAAA